MCRPSRSPPRPRGPGWGARATPGHQASRAGAEGVECRESDRSQSRRGGAEGDRRGGADGDRFLAWKPLSEAACPEKPTLTPPRSLAPIELCPSPALWPRCDNLDRPRLCSLFVLNIYVQCASNTATYRRSETTAGWKGEETPPAPSSGEAAGGGASCEGRFFLTEMLMRLPRGHPGVTGCDSEIRVGDRAVGGRGGRGPPARSDFSKFIFLGSFLSDPCDHPACIIDTVLLTGSGRGAGTGDSCRWLACN